MKVIDVSKLTRRKYLAEILEVGINDLRGYYKVRLLDYEDTNTPVLWVKDNINRYISDTHGQYLPLLPGDKVIIEFTDNTITSGMITQIQTPKKFSDKLKALDSDLLSNVNRYTIIKTDKNSSFVIDESQNCLTINFQNNTGEIKIDNNNINISHVNNINIESSNECKITTGNHIGIYSSKIDIDIGQYQKTANTENINYDTYSESIQKFKTIQDAINKDINYIIDTYNENNNNNDTIYDLLNRLNHIQKQNSIVKIQYNPTDNSYIIHVKSIDTFKTELKNKIQEQISKSNIQELITNIKQNYEGNKTKIINMILNKLDSLDTKLTDTQAILENTQQTNTQLYNALNKLKTFVDNLRNQLTNGI